MGLDRSTHEAFTTYHFPSCSGPGGYTVTIWNDLKCYDIVLYEIYKPNGRLPHTFVITDFESHLKFFHHIYSTDAFDRHGYFVAQLWSQLFPGIPYRPQEFDISIAEEDEVVVHRRSAVDVVLSVMGDILMEHDMNMCAL